MLEIDMRLGYVTMKILVSLSKYGVGNVESFVILGKVMSDEDTHSRLSDRRNYCHVGRVADYVC